MATAENYYQNDLKTYLEDKINEKAFPQPATHYKSETKKC